MRKVQTKTRKARSRERGLSTKPTKDVRVMPSQNVLDSLCDVFDVGDSHEISRFLPDVSLNEVEYEF